MLARLRILHKVTVSAWIYIFSAGDNNFILSKGDWNEVYALLSIRGDYAFNSAILSVWDALPTHQWIQVAGTSTVRPFVLTSMARR